MGSGSESPGIFATRTTSYTETPSKDPKLSSATENRSYSDIFRFIARERTAFRMITSRLRHRPRGTAIFLSRYLKIRITLGLKSEAITRDVESEREEEKGIGSKNPENSETKIRCVTNELSLHFLHFIPSINNFI